MNIALADAAQLVAITVAVLLVFFRSARFMKQVTDAINASEERLRNEIAASSDRLRDENTASEERLRNEIAASSDRLRDENTASEERLRNEIAASSDRLRSENREAHAAITRNIDDVKQDVREVKQDIRMLTQHLLHRDGADRLQGPST